MLEEGSFRGRTADFVVMFLFGGILMIVSFYTTITMKKFKKMVQNNWKELIINKTESKVQLGPIKLTKSECPLKFFYHCIQ